MQVGEKMMDADGGKMMDANGRERAMERAMERVMVMVAERDLGEVREVQDDGRRWTVDGRWCSRWWRLGNGLVMERQG